MTRKEKIINWINSHEKELKNCYIPNKLLADKVIESNPLTKLIEEETWKELERRYPGRKFFYVKEINDVRSQVKQELFL